MSHNQNNSQNTGCSIEHPASATRDNPSNRRSTKKPSLFRRLLARILCSKAQDDEGPPARPAVPRGHTTNHDDGSRQGTGDSQRSVTGNYNHAGSEHHGESGLLWRTCNSVSHNMLWHKQPKDDESMVKLFKNVDGRLTDHTLNFYIAQKDDANDDKTLGYSESVRVGLKDCAINLEGSTQDQEGSLTYMLHAIIANRVLMKAIEAVEKYAPLNPERASSWQPMVDEIALTTHHDVASFALKSSNHDARLNSMRGVVRSAIKFAFARKNQPVNFELLGFSDIQNPVVFDPQTMDEVCPKPITEGSSVSKVQAIVFPGLRKQSETSKGHILLKARVLL